MDNIDPIQSYTIRQVGPGHFFITVNANNLLFSAVVRSQGMSDGIIRQFFKNNGKAFNIELQNGTDIFVSGIN